MAAAIVLTAYIRAAAPLELLWRPLVIAVAVALIAQLALIVVLGWRRGSFWAAVLTAGLGGLPLLAGILVSVLTALSVVRRWNEYRVVGAAVGLSAPVVVAAIVGLGLASGAFDWAPLPLDPIDVELSEDGPSIYVLLLDGYPRADTLLQEFGYDNTPFLEAMRERQFDVYNASLSNYDRTPFTLISMLSLRHLKEVKPLWSSIPTTVLAQQRVATRALLAMPLFDAFERAGYSTRVISGPISSVPLGGAEITVTAGTANDFELTLVQRTLLAMPLELIGFAAGQHRSHIETAFELFTEETDARTFTFAHVMAPHPPFVFHADGADASAPRCYPGCDIYVGSYRALGWTKARYGERLAEHVQHVNRLVLEAVDRIVARDPEAVIVVMSDHGSRYDPDDAAEQFRNVLIARTPGHPKLLGDKPTLINVFPHLLNAYMEVRVELLEDSRWEGGHGPWLAVKRVAQ